MSEAIVNAFIDRVRHAFHEDDASAHGKQLEAANVQQLQSLYQLIARGDFAAFRDALAEDIQLEIAGPATTPFLGQWRGREVVASAIWNNFAKVEAQEPTLQSIVAQGDVVVAIARERGRYRETGQDYNVHWVQVHTFNAGLLARTRQFVADARE